MKTVQLLCIAMLSLCNGCVSTYKNPVREQNFFNQLATAAKERVKYKIKYVSKYFKISYPNGDVPKNMGVCTDLVIRSYRELGVDLQKLVHEDMKTSFSAYPNLWGSTSTDTNIDHRRVSNLDMFFQRNAKVLPITANPNDYKKGDIIIWKSKKIPDHIAIVVEAKNDEIVYVHNQGNGPEYGSCLGCWPIVGHYGY